eukprot:gene3067-5844_t
MTSLHPQLRPRTDNCVQHRHTYAHTYTQNSSCTYTCALHNVPRATRMSAFFLWREEQQVLKQ